MLTNERKEKIREKAEKLSQMDGVQLLLIKTFQDGIVTGQIMERERLDKKEVI